LSTPTLILSGVIIVALLVAYVVLTITGHDAEQLLAALLAYLAGVGTKPAAESVVRASSSSGGSA
jgi:hypothetical protein